MPLDRKLLELLICPVTQGPLEYDHEHNVLISPSAKLVYPIRESIPVLIEAQAMDLQEWTDQGKPELHPVVGAEETSTDQATQKENVVDQTKENDSSDQHPSSN